METICRKLVGVRLLVVIFLLKDVEPFQDEKSLKGSFTDDLNYFNFFLKVYYIYNNLKIIIMSAFADNLPDDLLEMLSKKADELGMPQNKLVEKALRIFLEQINRAEYVRSYKRASNDEDILDLAEEGMEEYLKQIEE